MSKNLLISFFKCNDGKWEGDAWTLKWLSKVITAINWFSGVQTGIIFAEHINECKCIKQTSFYMYDRTPEHALTLVRLGFLKVVFSGG